jgi:oligopeptide/dipeptide ABC transporter ATP-binding protein
LIADEPTTALDVTVQAQIVALFKEATVQRNIGLLLITHDLGVIAQICDKVAVMYAGTVVEFGDVMSIFNQPKHPYTASLLHCIPKLGMQKGILKAIPGNVPSVRTFPSGCRFHPRCGDVASACQLQKPGNIHLDNGINVACLKYFSHMKGSA